MDMDQDTFATSCLEDKNESLSFDDFPQLNVRVVVSRMGLFSDDFLQLGARLVSPRMRYTPTYRAKEDVFGLSGGQDSLNTNITRHVRIKSTEYKKKIEKKTTTGEKLRYEPTHVRGFWDEIDSWKTTGHVRMKSTEDKKKTENKTTGGEKPRYEPTRVQGLSVELDSWISTLQARIKATEGRKQTQKNTISREKLNDETFCFKWILFLLFLVNTIASSTASTQFAATNPIQTFNVTKGTDAMIRFDNLEYHQSAIPYFTLRYESQEQPFCCRSHVHNTLINSGLRALDQEDRFSVEGLLANDTFSVILNILNVSVQDEGRIKLVFMLLNHIEHISVTRTAKVNILIPPAKTKCHFARKAIIGHHYHVVRCHTPPENGNVTLSCFQSNSKINPIDIITDNNDMIRGIFLARFGDQVQCCSHPTTDDVTQETCDHSIFHNPKSITTPISNNSSPETTESPFHLDSRRTSVIDSTNSSDQVCVFMPWIPLYLRVIILAYISLFNLMHSGFSLNIPNAF